MTEFDEFLSNFDKRLNHIKQFSSIHTALVILKIFQHIIAERTHSSRKVYST